MREEDKLAGGHTIESAFELVLDAKVVEIREPKG